MKTELPCHIVRDLLPSYLEGLTEEETTAAVKAHLEACPDCQARWAAMSETSSDAVPAVPDTVEVDYLKAVRKKTRKKILLAVVLAVVLVLGLVSQKLFLRGWIADGSGLAVTPTVSEDGQFLHLDLRNTSSATVILGWGTRMYEDDGVLIVDAREALASPFHHPEDAVSMDLPLEGVRCVYLCGRLLWQEGLVIDLHTDRLFARKTPYVGNNSAVGDLVSNMDLDAPATLELQTAQEPYGLTLHFKAPIEERRRFLVEGNAGVLLALVDNLGEVSWDDPRGWTGSLTLEEANAALPELVAAYNAAHGTQLVPLDSVKDYGADAFSLQALRNLLGV